MIGTETLRIAGTIFLFLFLTIPDFSFIVFFYIYPKGVLMKKALLLSLVLLFSLARAWGRNLDMSTGR